MICINILIVKVIVSSTLKLLSYRLYNVGPIVNQRAEGAGGLGIIRGNKVGESE